jgi:hypothetical protein
LAPLKGPSARRRIRKRASRRLALRLLISPRVVCPLPHLSAVVSAGQCRRGTGNVSGSAVTHSRSAHPLFFPKKLKRFSKNSVMRLPLPTPLPKHSLVALGVVRGDAPRPIASLLARSRIDLTDDDVRGSLRGCPVLPGNQVAVDESRRARLGFLRNG